MQVRVSTVTLPGSGFLTCKRCAHVTTYPPALDNFGLGPGPTRSMMVYDLGTSIDVLSADTLIRMHRCGTKYVWRCPTCGCEPGQVPVRSVRELRRSARLHPVRDCDCGTRYEQVPVSALAV
jgi:hypothetical protein